MKRIAQRIKSNQSTLVHAWFSLFKLPTCWSLSMVDFSKKLYKLSKLFMNLYKVHNLIKNLLALLFQGFIGVVIII